MAISAINSTLQGILQGIATAALNQNPPDMDTFLDIQNWLPSIVSWPAYTAAAATATSGPLVFYPEITNAATGASWTNPAQGTQADSVAAAVKQTGINPKSLGA